MDSCSATPKDSAASMQAVVKAGRDAAEALLGAYAEFARLGLAAASPALKAGRGRCCEVPPPCWMPKSLGEIRTVACAGGTASIRLRITNGQPHAGIARVAFARTDLQTSVTPADLSLGPMERGRVTASVTLPADACKGQQNELLLWVHGCHTHYLRWTVEAWDAASGSCHEIEVHDCVDPIHHWYDHFYCVRSCQGHSVSEAPSREHMTARDTVR